MLSPLHWRIVPLLAILLLSSSGLPVARAETPPADHGTSHTRYLHLKIALQQYQRIADAGGWPAVPEGPTIRPESRDPRLAALARRLQISGDLEDNRREFLAYDDELQAAVLRFQSRHGLETDALVGRATLRALNVSADERVAQVHLNMDRVQQQFDTARKDYLLVNVPAFEAYLVRDGETVWADKVVVGETEAETPLFTATMSTVVLNPTWTVPHSIASEELLPKIQKDPGFLAQGEYELHDRDGKPVDSTDIDWLSLNKNNFPFTLVQRSGALNELGRIKFLFPNKYGVCMHDTPKKHLFAMYSRAFSHGCIRIQEPVDFGAALLDKEGWTRKQIDAHIQSGQTHAIRLAEPLPVVVSYLTTAVDESGTVYFYRDIYGNDVAAIARD